tara:strand:+ start:307 stop:612 length:306 start_codon:yes stop_codon:yes gene_type:complete
MADLEVFQNGNFSDGRPVFQVGRKKEDGTYDVVNANLMSKEEASAALAELQPAKTKRTRARTDEGHFVADDPATPENEAWVEEPVVKKKAPAKKKTTAKKK